ncbi:recombinase family protein [Dongia soli]|uniref:Recombinase family protein n=1 Tax=Dongia soli TaxID=600628 RepID=A0ABU5E8A5_9PROT|nr:recombinase family protein [Dongia soli]MDY0882270.1 recombinase family protein [Dongia soli]
MPFRRLNRITTMTRAAIYARYSSDLQSGHSIEDQLRICRERAQQLGASISREYADAAISGSHLFNRPGINSLLADARAGAFDTLLAEALDRISRDQEDIAAIFKRLRHAGVQIITLSEGEVNELHIGLKGTMNALFLKDLAAKIKRGQRGRAAAGSIPGGKTYGYRVVRTIDAAGELVRGKREVDEDQAAVVRKIFTWYAAGESPRAIAGRLNAERVPSARGGKWNASTINGNKARGIGILNNQLYIGRLTYNRQSYRKDPDTGQRLTRVNPEGERIATDVPALRIIDQDLWDAVQARLADLGGKPLTRRTRPRHLLSGLLRCGCCGANYIMVDATRFGCGQNRESGSCRNGRRIPAEKLQRRVLDGLRDQLLAPEVVATFVEEYRQGEKERQAELARSQAGTERRLREVTAKIERIVTAIADGTNSPTLRAALTDLEAERAELAAAQEEIDNPTVVALHPHLPEMYRQYVERLGEALSTPETRTEAIEEMRQLVDRIDIHPLPERGEFDLEIHGQIVSILAPEACSTSVRKGVKSMVPLKGFEPPTY